MDRNRGGGRGPRPLNPSQQLACALAFYRSGSFEHTAGHIIGCERPTACQTINRISRIIAAEKDTYIALPTSQELREMADENFRLFKIPGMI